jgi:outer membrane protein assembly factor BamE (lipoprotein component of BamABCDE complex)
MPVGRFIIGGPKARDHLSPRKAVRGLIAACIALPILVGCTPTVQTHGHSLEEEQIAQVKSGETSRQEVLQILGSPSALSTFDDDTWYYVSQRTEKTSFYQEGLVAQDVVAIAFDDQDRVAGVNRHGLDQMASIDPVDRVTPTAGSSPSILQQLIGNIGRFSSAPGADSP